MEQTWSQLWYWGSEGWCRGGKDGLGLGSGLVQMLNPALLILEKEWARILAAIKLPEIQAVQDIPKTIVTLQNCTYLIADNLVLKLEDESFTQRGDNLARHEPGNHKLHPREKMTTFLLVFEELTTGSHIALPHRSTIYWSPLYLLSWALLDYGRLKTRLLGGDFSPPCVGQGVGTMCDCSLISYCIVPSCQVGGYNPHPKNSQ